MLDYFKGNRRWQLHLKVQRADDGEIWAGRFRGGSQGIEEIANSGARHSSNRVRAGARDDVRVNKLSEPCETRLRFSLPTPVMQFVGSIRVLWIQICEEVTV